MITYIKSMAVISCLVLFNQCAKNPVTGEWFIVSAVNQLLVVADSNWTILNSYHLSGNDFNQPEGLAFDRDGNMYISNEGDDVTSGNILKFPRKEVSKY